MRIEEKILFREIQKQNRYVFEGLFYEYYPVLARYAESFVFDRQASEDIVQALFIYLWEHSEKLTIKTSIKAYLYQSTKNRCLNYLRDLQIFDKHKFLHLEAMLNNENKDECIETEIMEEIKIAINQLPPQMIKVFKLKYLEGKKQKEIANSMNISVNTVKTHLSRGKIKLRKILYKQANMNFTL